MTARPENSQSDGAHPDGAHPDGTHPDGAHPDSAHPDSAHPDSAHPDSALLDEILADQDGVIARGQVLALGFTPAFVRRKVRRREWATVHPGVFVDHTGPLTWRQRAWSAVLDAAPAALSHGSADPRSEPTGPIHIVVDRARRVTRRPGVVVHYGTRLDEKVAWHAHPPRVRMEQALLDMAECASSKVRVVACLADAVQAGKTTADRVLVAAQRRPRLRRRAFIEGVLVDIRDGTCSVLEHGYLTKVERAQGLPSPQRQASTTVGRRGFRDVDYPGWGLVVELDGRMGHDGAADRDVDMERDLDAAVDADRLTLRLGWGQVFDRACSTADKVGRALTARGWTGTPVRCPSCRAVR
ncbi:hypothetical protein AAFP35_07825 [Gordonia sp. CPCC 206044]|uniref:hypothetical protein n=1 Tax=Gordonia sp. CPCC 206044 TaxID=3140793 RepID=UPI003AF33373